MALRVNQDNFEEKVLKADKPVLLDFYSDTCMHRQLLDDLMYKWQGNVHAYVIMEVKRKHEDFN